MVFAYFFGVFMGVLLSQTLHALHLDWADIVRHFKEKP